MASTQCQPKHNENCPKQSHHTKLGQKFCEMTNKACKGHGNTNTKTETHCFTETQTSQNATDQGEATTTEITLLVVQARITQTNANHHPPGPPAHPRGTTTTTCFGNHARKNRDPADKKDWNLFHRIKDGVSRHNNKCDGDSSDSGSDSDKENCRTKKK